MAIVDDLAAAIGRRWGAMGIAIGRHIHNVTTNARLGVQVVIKVLPLRLDHIGATACHGLRVIGIGVVLGGVLEKYRFERVSRAILIDGRSDLLEGVFPRTVSCDLRDGIGTGGKGGIAIIREIIAIRLHRGSGVT